MKDVMRFAVFGAGFWARFQLAAWRELPGVECVAIYNRTRSRAEALAAEFGIPAVYDDPEELLRREQLNFVDVITSPDSHRPLVELVATHGLPVICQKPMAPTLEDARAMVAACQAHGVPFFVHENWRWQRPIRQLHALLARGEIGNPFRARIEFCCSFPVFDNQPFLRELERFILSDMGSHLLDVARFLFGEAQALWCTVARINPGIKGEDVATVMMRMHTGCTVICQMSYATVSERERFPETFIFVEGERGSAEVAPDCWLRLTTRDGTFARRYPPKRYPWADPEYALVHASIVDCQANLLQALRGQGSVETTAADNLRTVELVDAAYRSAATGRLIEFAP